jgi:predicted ester cyclase
METVQNKAVMRRYIEAHNAKDLKSLVGKIDEFYTSNYVLHHPGSPDLQRGTASFEQYVQNNIQEMSELHITMDDVIGERDKLAIRLTFRYKHVPTGKILNFSSMSFIKFIEGKMAEEWEVIMPEQEPDKKP